MFSNTPTTVVVGRDSTVIAVSGGRHSNGAVKWAVEHLLKKNSSCILLHVRTKTMLTRRYLLLSLLNFSTLENIHFACDGSFEKE